MNNGDRYGVQIGEAAVVAAFAIEVAGRTGDPVLGRHLVVIQFPDGRCWVGYVEALADADRLARCVAKFESPGNPVHNRRLALSVAVEKAGYEDLGSARILAERDLDAQRQLAADRWSS